MKTHKIFAIALTGLLSVWSAGLVLAEELPPAFGADQDSGQGEFYSTSTTDSDSVTATELPAPTGEESSPAETAAEPDGESAPAADTPRAFEDFTDVPVDHPYYNAIIVLRYQGVISGYPDNTFRPEQPLNRVEALKLVFEVAAIAMNNGVAKAQFSDTEEMAWYSGYLNKAVYLEIVSGYADGTFRPDQAVNLVEFLKMLLLAQNVDLSAVNLNQLPYADVMPGQWYSKYINYAKIHDLIRVGEDNLVYPGEPLTRARAADIIYRFRNYNGADGAASGTEDSSPDSQSAVVPVKDFALFVSASQKFAVQYPKVWFYSAFVEKLDPAALAVYGFGPDDLSANPPRVILELLPDSAGFTTNLYSEGFIYFREEKSTGDSASGASTVVLSAKIDGSTRIYRLTGPLEEEATMLTMLKSLTVDIDGLESYNPATPAATSTMTESTDETPPATTETTESTDITL